MLPVIVSQLVVLLKDTALGYIIAYPELLQRGVNVLSANYGNVVQAAIVVGDHLHHHQLAADRARRLAGAAHPPQRQRARRAGATAAARHRPADELGEPRRDGGAGPARPIGADGSAGDLGDPGLADDRDPDLTRVGQLLLDLLGHVAGQHGGADVVDVVRAAPSPGSPGRPASRRPSPRPACRPAISSIRSSRLTYASRLSRRAPGRPPEQASAAWVSTASMVCGGTSLWCASIACTTSSVSPYLRARSAPISAWLPSTSWVSALPMSCRNAHRLISGDVEPQLGGHDAGDVRGLDQVLEHVLAVRRAVAQPAEQRHQLGVDVGDADLDQRVLGRALAQPLDLVPGRLEDLLDAVRVDPPVEHQLLQRQPADLAPHRVEAGQQHRLRACRR